MNKMKRLPLACKTIDDMLGGGIEYQSITEVHGEAGSGKTNFCLQASRECAKKGKKVAYIDSEGVSTERVDQICKNCDSKKILQNILFYQPTSFDEQEKMISKALNLSEVGLVVVDTINLHYRIGQEEDKDSAMRCFTRQVGKLQMAAMQKNISVLITEQVYSDKNGEIKPFTNRDIEHMVKTMLKLEKVGIGKRRVTIIKHRSLPEGQTALFSVTSTGLE